MRGDGYSFAARYISTWDAPDWAVDTLFELEDPLPGCYLSLVEGAGPGEVTAKRPSRGRPRAKHSRHA